MKTPLHISSGLLPAGDCVFFAMANGYGFNSAAYKLNEYR